MEVLLLRATLAPLLILLTSIAAQRLGPRFGGRLLGLPLTTAPFLVVLYLEHGPLVAADAAHGAALGQLTVVTFCLVYACLARKMRPVSTVAIAVLCGAAAEMLVAVTQSLWLSGVAIGTAVGATVLKSQGFNASVPMASKSVAAASADQPPPPRVSRWDLPVRMAVSGTVVLTLATIAPLVGPVLAGALSALPVLLVVMAPSVHRANGGHAAAALMQGTLASASGTIVFVIVLSVMLVPAGPWVAFALGLGAMAAADPVIRCLGAVRRLVPRDPVPLALLGLKSSLAAPAGTPKDNQYSDVPASPPGTM
ncbi:hypothetical protein LWC34_10890 [Kibdelosporangium philippinense]|uniref:Uncharacterized protein n=1 Tax=Kibdelosporangium philippinense TaxID=211113 RepID=A0ABS8Z8I2_9PSEU|nr:hypothetical protein [Kibdelosporangium philippinense]MCE7003328.1 hypothetical protein [Kibdelosporangium philippinense]